MSTSFFNLCVRRSLVAVMWSAKWGAAPRRKYMRGGDIVLLHIQDTDIERARLGLPLLARRRRWAPSRFRVCIQLAMRGIVTGFIDSYPNVN
jgi:hypothetical protein